MAITQDVVFTASLGTASGTHTINSELVGTTVNVCLIGEGGAGGAGHSDGEGGGGGGAGGVVFGTMAAQGGDVFTVTHTPANDRTTAGNGSAGGQITISNGRTGLTWTANGGSGGVRGENGAGGAGGTGSGTGASVNGGGRGGNSGGSGSPAQNGQTGTGTGASAGGTGGTNGSSGFAGGGGGGRGGLPSYVTDALADFSITTDPRNGGRGATSSTDGPTSSRSSTSTVYNPTDGEDGKIDTSTGSGLDELAFVGFGGGGAGAVGGGTTGNALGGAGGNAMAVINYEFDGTPPVITLTGNTTSGNPHLVERGTAYQEPGATAVDTLGESIAVTTTLPAGLQGTISGAVGTQHTVTYSATDSDGVTSDPTSRVCQIQDTLAPVIVLNGSPNEEIQVDTSPGASYTDPGATGFDNGGEGSNPDGTYALSDMTVTGTVNVGVIGTYTRTYNLTDARGNAAQTVTRTVNVVAVVSTRANTTGPHSTPSGATAEIRFSDIISASQLFKRVTTSTTTVSQTDMNLADTQPRILQNNSMDYLRGWYNEYGAPSNATRTLNSPNPGSVGLLTGSTTDGTQVGMSQFKSYSALSTKIRVQAETAEPYRNSNDGAIEVASWGPDNVPFSSSAAGRFTIRTRGSYQTTWTTAVGLREGATLVRSGAGRNIGSTAGGDSTVGDTSKRDPNTSYVYSIQVLYSNPTTGATVTHSELSVTIGQTGSVSTSLSYDSGTANFQWNRNQTALSTWSDYMIEHLNPIIERTRV